jgi:indolepyruvate ferredoxin oxidoreductase beta subunit
VTAQGPLTILVAALGGEGGGVLSGWLYDAAVRAGHAAQATSIPGVAQRTGATTYYIEIAREAGAPRPVFSLNPVPGSIDLLVSSELLETARQVGNGMTSVDRTTVVTSTTRALTVAEKMQPGDGRSDVSALLAVIERHAQALSLLDVDALARQAGSAVSAVLFGALAGTGRLPFGRYVCEQTIRASARAVEASLRGFALAHDAAAASRSPSSSAPAPIDLYPFARQRLIDYQDETYAELFDARLARLAAAEGGVRGAVSTEALRWLALWMAFDDIVRVAALKLAASREQRVRREVQARDDEIVRTYDHFKPGVAEFAALLPARWAARLHRWDERRVARGRVPWALPLRIGTHTVTGVLALKLLAALKGQRRRGSRYATEQALIDRWLGAVERGAREDAPLGLALARCGRLIKGYGSTNERGKANLLHIIDHLASAPSSPAQRAQAVQATLDAALADDSGSALDRQLLAHGAPVRPLREQPIRWHKRRPPPEAPAAR